MAHTVASSSFTRALPARFRAISLLTSALMADSVARSEPPGLNRLMLSASERTRSKPRMTMAC